MNKNLLIGLAGVVVFVSLFFVFNRDQKIKNYPSKGTDVIAFGDSLIQGFGSTENNDLVSLLSQKTGKRIINLGVSGNTTRDGLDRLSELDKYRPKVVILLLGGNDYLKKIPQTETFSNLEKIIKNIQDRGAVVLLLGVRGGILVDKFEDDFQYLSEKTESAFVSNVLDGLFANAQYMSDTIHPNDIGYSKIATRVYPVLQKVIK